MAGLGAAYDQTDVMHDRSYLIANLAHSNKRIRQQAEVALANLDRQEALAQRDYGLQQRDLALQNQQQAQLQHQLNWEANQRRLLAHTGSLELDRQLKMDRDTEIDEQGYGLLQSMMKLDAAKRRGEITKDQYDQGLIQAGEQFPLGTRHPEAAKHYQFAVTEADRQNDFNARKQFAEAARVGARYGIGVQSDPETGLPSIEHTQLAALQTPKGKNEALGQLNTEMAHKYGITTGVGSLFNPVAPHVGTDAEGNQVENPTHTAIPFVDTKTGTVGKLAVPTQLFDQMKTDFQDRYFALNPPSAQPAGAAPTASTAAPAGVTGTIGHTGVAGIPQISSQADYEALPAGATFLSGGKQYKKPAGE
jgi:hypothetical protein